MQGMQTLIYLMQQGHQLLALLLALGQQAEFEHSLSQLEAAWEAGDTGLAYWLAYTWAYAGDADARLVFVGLAAVEQLQASLEPAVRNRLTALAQGDPDAGVKLAASRALRPLRTSVMYTPPRSLANGRRRPLMPRPVTAPSALNRISRPSPLSQTQSLVIIPTSLQK